MDQIGGINSVIFWFMILFNRFQLSISLRFYLVFRLNIWESSPKGWSPTSKIRWMSLTLTIFSPVNCTDYIQSPTRLMGGVQTTIEPFVLSSSILKRSSPLVDSRVVMIRLRSSFHYWGSLYKIFVGVFGSFLFVCFFFVRDITC